MATLYPQAWDGLTPTSRGEPIQPSVLPPVECWTTSSRGLLTRRVDEGSIVRPRRGAYVEPSDAGKHRALTLMRLAALKVTLKEPFVVVGPSAAALIGLWTPMGDGLVHIAVASDPSSRFRDDPWLVRHNVAIPEDQRRLHEGMVVTSAERTMVDCARMAPTIQAIATVDAGLVVGADMVVVQQILDSMAGYRHIRRARTTIGMARPSGSPLESGIRVEMVEEGLPTPDTLVVLRLSDGERLELDAGWPDIRLGVDINGEEKYERGAERSEQTARVIKARSRKWRLLNVSSTQAREVRMQIVTFAFREAWLDRYRRPWRPD